MSTIPCATMCSPTRLGQHQGRWKRPRPQHVWPTDAPSSSFLFLILRCTILHCSIFFLSFVIVFQRYRFFWFYELNESSTSRKWLFFSLFRFDSRSFFAQKRKEETSGFMCVCVLYRWVLLSSNSFLAGHCRVPYTLISFLSIGSPLLGCNVI